MYFFLSGEVRVRKNSRRLVADKTCQAHKSEATDLQSRSLARPMSVAVNRSAPTTARQAKWDSLPLFPHDTAIIVATGSALSQNSSQILFPTVIDSAGPLFRCSAQRSTWRSANMTSLPRNDNNMSTSAVTRSRTYGNPIEVFHLFIKTQKVCDF